jgi:hypothetical protein
MSYRPKIITLTLFLFAVAILASLCLAKYPGRGFVYIIFTLVCNACFIYGFHKNSLFFDLFIGLFFWLGFWLKLTLRVLFSNGIFHEATGQFDHSGASFDQALVVTCCAVFGLMAAAIIRQRIFSYPENHARVITQPALFSVYAKYRSLILWTFFALFVFVASSNVYFGIYQRGQIPNTVLPYGLGGVFKWLLLFGMSSIAAVMLQFEYVISKKSAPGLVLLSLLEGCFSNVSLLSRGMILNQSALIYGLFRSLKSNAIPIRLRFWAASFLVFSVLFVASVFLSNYLRSDGTISALASVGAPSSRVRDAAFADRNASVNSTIAMTGPLFIDRWVGMEGVLAVVGSDRRGWALWQAAWREKYSEYSTSFYDLNLIESPYLTADTTKNHFISLPGIVAFLYYPGSYLFLFTFMFLAGAIAAAIEIFAYQAGGKNLILCSLFGQVIAYRYCSFGYAPEQTYLLFGTLLLNVIIFNFTEKLLSPRPYK